MLEAFSAEALKMRRHKATWFLVWLYPILFTIIFIIAIGVGLFGGDQRPAQVDVKNWIEDAVIVWIVPTQTLGRYLIAAFVAVVFAGEYGWNTWKLVIPHRSRTALIAAKYGVILALFAIALTVTAIISTIGAFAEVWSSVETTPAGITAGLLAETHGKFALAALPALLVTLGYASLAAVLTRSTIGALVISIVVLTIEQLLLNFAPILSVRFDAIIDLLYPVLPGYHLNNLSEWIREGVGLTTKFPDGDVVAYSAGTSLAAIGAWLAALYAAVFFIFRRQDIN